jgi:spermidine synthase
MGSTTYAIGTVLAAFMAGLGLGAWLLGARADRAAQPLRLYAVLELAIGVFGMASPFVLAQGGVLYERGYALLHDRPALLTLARFLIGFLFVAAPAALMGGTLPVMVRHLVRRSDAVGRDVARLYAVNTLGACAGALLLPFALLPAFGIRACLLAGGAVNAAIGVIAWVAAGWATPAAAPAAPAPERPAAGPAASRLLPAFFLSGFVALGLEAVWNRFFGIYFGSSIYAYAVILCVYLAGIAAGSAAFAPLARRGVDPARVFAVCLFLLVVDLAVTVPLMDRILYVHLVFLDALGGTFVNFQIATAAAAVLVILPPTLLFGASFPAVAAAAGGHVERVGSAVGRVYLVNTAGTVAGALAASFVLIPWLGVRRSLDLLIVVAVGAVLLAHRGGRAVPALAAALAALPLVLPGWDVRLMHLSLGRDATLVLHRWRDGKLPEDIAAMNVREVRDGVDATVSVAETPESLALYVNGKIDASNGDMFTQLTLGHLPVLVHPAPRDVLVIGMGSGVTVAAVARHPVASIDVVELAPEVMELAGRHFAELNRDVLHDPRLGVHVEDGRNFVAFRRRQYDVIISEPSNPWMTGVANLFTDDFFRQARARLRPGGVLSQWFHTYNMRLEDIRVLLATIRHHFAHVYVFALMQVGSDLQIVASQEPLDFSRVVAATSGEGPAWDDLRSLDVTNADQLLIGLALSPENVDRFTAGAPLNSDDRPRIELQAPRALFEDTVIGNQRALFAVSDGARLPVASEPSRVHATAPDGFRRVFGGFRTAYSRSGDEFTLELLRTLVYEGPDGGHLEVVSGGDTLTRAELDRLAAFAAHGAVAAYAEAVVHGHDALAYRAEMGGQAVLAWGCSESKQLHAVAYPADADPEAMVGGIVCHGA